MSFVWLKPYMPRGLYGRATLILLLPVITLLLVVSIVSVQRLFEGVTEQMARSVSREINLLLQNDTPIAAPGARKAMADALRIEMRSLPSEDLPETHTRRWYDFSGSVAIREFERILPDLAAVELPDDQVVRLYIDLPQRALELQFDRRRLSAKNAHQLPVNMVFFGVLMTAIAFFYLRNQLRPITRLARAAEAFGRGRHVPYRPAGAVEVRAAGHAFLDMRARIERQIEQRTLMLSGVSHDMRTPLTRLRLSLAMLDAEEREPMLQDIDEMERLLDEFLAFARDAAEGEPEPVDPVALVRQIVEDCARSNIPARLRSTEGEGTVPLRRAAIRRAVENLINNAVRYGSRAELSVMMSERSLRIRVEDDGPGIPADRREEAVRPFTRLDPARNQDRGSGVGLGLSIATDIARAHGGMLRLATSKRLGGLRADIVISR